MSSPSNAIPDFEQLVSEYYQNLFRFAFSLVKNESEASDLVQETFLIWAQKGESLRDVSKVKSWLFTTLYREFLRIRRRGMRVTDLEPDDFERELPAVQPDVIEAMEAQDVVNSLDELDDIYREPLTLFYLEDLSYKEIADVLGIPMGTVMSRLSRGKSQLKRALQRKV